MITLNDEKELVRVALWEEILERPDYVRDVDPKSIKLESIIGSYVFPEPVPCGLSTCHQPHNKGYLVVTSDKAVTNIGNFCGKKHFSVDFQTLRKRFDRDVRIKAQKEALRAFSSQLPAFESQIAELRAGVGGADWVHKLVSKLKTPASGVPERIWQTLQEMVRSNSGQIKVQRQATREEADLQEEAQGKPIQRPFFIEEQRGFLEGVEALRGENDLREILAKDLLPGIQRISELDVEGASEHQLSIESKWAGEFPAKLQRAEKAVSLGARLLTQSNLSQLLVLLDSPRHEEDFKAFLKGLPK